MMESDMSSAGGELTPERLKKAFKAFKKRLKLAQLDDSSTAGGALSGGNRGLTAVRPPDIYPKEVWEELARQGRLKSAGQGLYELPK
ncbi:MAG: hypothetical protein JXD22_01060 [Sedimentisphaerales bacterium]|nr:hypothetical protein [Sedimentisphaerales bacterium]